MRSEKCKAKRREKSTYALLAATDWLAQRRATLSKCVSLFIIACSTVCAQWAPRVLMQTGCYVFLLWLDNEESRKIVTCMCLCICISGVVVFVFGFSSAKPFFVFLSFCLYRIISCSRAKEMQDAGASTPCTQSTLFGCTVYPSLCS